MKLEKVAVALLLGGVWSPAVLAQAPTEPPAQAPTEPLAQAPTEPPAQVQPDIEEPPPAAPRTELPPPAPLKAAPTPPAAPRTATAEPSTADSEDLTTRAASAEISGDPQEALAYAGRAIAADASDPWPHYVRAAALSRMGKVDDALKAFADAEHRFAASDTWARSVAIYGAAHALAEAGRCDEARAEYQRYASFVRARDPKSADMATRYASNCKPVAPR
jgi:tetratricopeptide (TPR) repeat protein